MADKVRQSLKCGRCRLDRQKCRFNASDSVCDRCKKYDYVCSPALAKPDSRQRRLNGRKCIECRNSKQKCLPEDRVWPKRCDLCVRKGLPCSEPRSVKHSPRAPLTVSDDASLRPPSFATPSHPAHGNYEVDNYKILLESLRFDRMHARQRDVVSAIPGTCNWIVSHSHFQAWMDDSKRPEHNGFLWIKGKPGSGKSTIMKEIISHVEKRSPYQNVVSFFFSARSSEPLQKSTLGVYRSLLHQILLLQEHSKSRELFTQIFESKVRDRRIVEDWRETELQNFLTKLVNSDGLSGNVIVFIDALDEGEDSDVRSMINFLELFNRQSSMQHFVRICLSSRHYPAFSTRRGLVIVVENEGGHKLDIDTYTSTKLTRGIAPHVRQFQNKIRHRSAGMFLWVDLIVLRLNTLYDQGKRPATMLDRIDTTPVCLNELFTEILCRDAEDIEECCTLLRWVSFSFQPLGPLELYEATQLRSSNASSYSKDILGQDLPDPVTVLRYILNCSRGLVELSLTKPTAVQFIHSSVRDFLISANNKFASCHTAYAAFKEFDADSCHLAIAEDSLRYLIGEAQNPRHITSQDTSLALYAARYWFQHGQQSKKRPRKRFLDLAHDLITNESYLRTWIGFYNIEMIKIGEETVIEQDPNLRLYYACWIGIPEVVATLLREGEDVNTQGRNYGTPLRAAMRKGHQDVVNLLIDAGASPSPLRNRYNSLLFPGSTQSLSDMENCSSELTGARTRSDEWREQSSALPSSHAELFWSPPNKLAGSDRSSFISQTWEFPMWPTITEPTSVTRPFLGSLTHADDLIRDLDAYVSVFNQEPFTDDFLLATDWSQYPEQIGQDTSQDLSGIGSVTSGGPTYSSAGPSSFGVQQLEHNRFYPRNPFE